MASSVTRVPQDEIDLLVGVHCTLDGERATISGRLMKFATIVSLDDFSRSVEFCWDTVIRIMANGGEFRS